MSVHYKNHPAVRSVNPETEFIFKNGRKAKNVPELVEVISGCNDDEFQHHCNDSKNDFAVWIRDAVGDTVLYESFKDSKTRDQAINGLKAYLKRLEAHPSIIHKLTSNNETLKRIVEKLVDRMRQDAAELNDSGKAWLDTRYSVKDVAVSVVLGILAGIMLTIGAII